MTASEAVQYPSAYATLSLVLSAAPSYWFFPLTVNPCKNPSGLSVTSLLTLYPLSSTTSLSLSYRAPYHPSSACDGAF